MDDNKKTKALAYLLLGVLALWMALVLLSFALGTGL